MQNLKKNIFCFKNNKRWNLTWALATCTFICSFCAKYLMLDIKKYRGVIFHDTEGWCKTWTKTDLWFGNWNEKYGKLSPEHLKVSKLEFWWDPFVQNEKYMSWKFTLELCVMTMKNDTKIKEKLTCSFKIYVRNFTNFDPSIRKPKMFVFLLAPSDRSIICLSYKSTEELSFMSLKSFANFEEKLTCGLKKNMGNLANFHWSSWKCQTWDFVMILLSKVEKVWP